MGPDQLRRKDRLGPALDRLPFESIIAVGCPDPLGALEDAEIHARTAGGAALYFDVGVRLSQFVDQSIGGESLFVGRRSTGVPHLAEVAILVPFQVGDRVVAEQGVESLEDVGEGRRIHQVEHLLVPPADRRAPEPGTADPVGVRANHIRVLVNHLGFYPESELHTAGSHRIDQRGEAPWPDILIHVPVPQSGTVGTAVTKPAVVEHEAFDTEKLGAVRKLNEAVQLLVEVHRFPGVEYHRSHGGGMRCP